MYRPRIIPVLLLKDLGLVKSKRFSKNSKFVYHVTNMLLRNSSLTNGNLVIKSSA